jgi:ligand-binding sensor domain-containing protein/DNA-binding CsgD family transcriptional regulator
MKRTICMLRPSPSPARRRLLRLLIVLLLLVFHATVTARTFTPVGAGKGLEAWIVTSMMFDQQGFLWVGSHEGLFRYDGHQAIAFQPELGNPDAISAIDVRSLYEAADGSIWVGTHTGGLNRYDPASGTFAHFRHDAADPDSLPDDGIYSLSAGPGGDLWAGTLKGLSRFDRQTERFERFTHDPANPASLSHDQVVTLHLSAAGNLWVGTVGGGVNRWNPQRRDFSRFDLARLTAGTAKRNRVFALHEDDDGILWAGTEEGLVRLDPGTGQADSVGLVGQDGDLPFVTSMQIDPSKRLWLTTRGDGLFVVDCSSGQWSIIQADAGLTTGAMPASGLNSLALGAEHVFIGTSGGGVYRTPLHETRFELMSTLNTPGMTNNVISTVLATAEEGQLWLGSFGGGPQRADVGKRAVGIKPLRLHEMRNSDMLSVAGPVDGLMYAGTTKGLYEFTDDGAQLALFAHEPGRPDGIAAGSVTALLPAAAGALWLGTSGGGLQYFEVAEQRFTSYRHQADRADSISGDFITALLDEPPGYLWVGTRSNGLNRCRIENWSCERFSGQPGGPGHLSHPRVNSFYRDRRGRVWVATGGGLNQVLQDEGGRVSGFRQWRAKDGLLHDAVLAIQEDLDESLWLSSSKGLSRLNPATGAFINFSVQSGLQVSHFNPNAAAADDSHIYFGSTGGLLIIPKGSLLEPGRPPHVRILAVNRIGPGRAQPAMKLTGTPLRVPYADMVSVEMAVLDYAESSHQYAYRLAKAEPWSELGQQREIVFSGLQPGHYELQVRGRGVHGIWGVSEALPLEIIPPIWMTGWFRGLILLLLLALALGTHFLRQATLKKRAGEMLRLGERRERALEEKLGSAAELAVLTPRQKEILQLVAEGSSTREIAELLGVSIKTVEAHRANLMERLDIHDVPGLVRLAIRCGLISLKEDDFPKY